MSRSADGEGSSVQVRGLSNNNVEINGQTVAGSSADRSINFQDLPSELFSAIEIQKAPTADKIEGSLGGTINLKTRRPLNNNKDFVASVTAKAKYAEIADEVNPDYNAFVLNNWRDTAFGDIGLIVNAGVKELTSVTEAYGGGDYEAAPAAWIRRDGSFVPPTGPNNANGANKFHPDRGAGVWAFDNAIDVNSDGVSNEGDVYYVPGEFGFYEMMREDKRSSFNTTLHWQPNDDWNVYFDTTKTTGDELLTGSRYSITFNAARVAPLASGDNNFEFLNSTQALGDVHLMNSGRLGNATTRMGASPSINQIERESERFTVGAEWQASDNLKLALEATTSEGSANTIQQGALIMGIDANGNGKLTGYDFAQLADYDFTSGRMPDVTFYQSPFKETKFGLDATQTSLTAISPTDANYERLAYFQFNRVAQDTENSADAIRFDGEYEFDDGFFTKVKFGARQAERGFQRISFENPNQRAGMSTLYNEGDELNTGVNVQAILVNPESNTDAGIKAAAEYLKNCQAQGGRDDFFADENTNLPRTWTTTRCSADEMTAAFGLKDIRTLNEETGVGIYEKTGLRYDVEEKTSAVYLAADYLLEIGNLPITGNMGVRYVETETTSSGYLKDADGVYQTVSFSNTYQDVLPSLNANLALNDEMLLRLGVSRTLGRPGLARIAPSLNINYNDNNDGFQGNGTGGNPFLKPVHANNVDVSFEWYYGEESLITLAYFNKNIDSTISLNDELQPIVVGSDNILLRTYDNFGGTEIDGVELAMQHAFTSLPGLLSNTGLGLNYTYTQEESDLADQEGDSIARKGLSETSYNLNAFYDDGKFTLRLAYNWRDEFVRREFVTLGWGQTSMLPEVEAARGQLDLTANYQFNKHLKVNFSAVNLNESETRRYMKHEQLLNYLANPGRRFNLGLVYRF